MEGKKAVIIYTDMIHIVEKLIKKDRENKTNNSGELLYHFLQYVNDKNPEPINEVIELVFEPIKQQLKRDLRKYENRISKLSAAGKLSAEARKLKATDSISTESSQPASTDSTKAAVNLTSVNTKTDAEIFEQLKFELFNSSVWLSDICRNNSIQLQKVKMYLTDFCKKLQDEKDYFKPFADAQKHFVRWMKIQIESENKKGVKRGANGEQKVVASTSYAISKK